MSLMLMLLHILTWQCYFESDNAFFHMCHEDNYRICSLSLNCCKGCGLQTEDFFTPGYLIFVRQGHLIPPLADLVTLLMMRVAVVASNQIAIYKTYMECVGKGGALMVDDLSHCLLSLEVQLYMRSVSISPNLLIT